MIEVLSVASEAYPLIKTGGLADVVGALPSALAPHGVSMRVLVPGYPKVMDALGGNGREVYYFADFFGGEARLIAGRAKGLDVIALEAHHLYTRPGSPYLGPDGRDFPDNWRRYAALSYAAYELSTGTSAWQNMRISMGGRRGPSFGGSRCSLHWLPRQWHT